MRMRRRYLTHCGCAIFILTFCFQCNVLNILMFELMLQCILYLFLLFNTGVYGQYEMSSQRIFCCTDGPYMNMMKIHDAFYFHSGGLYFIQVNIRWYTV